MLTVFQELAKKMSRKEFEWMGITCWIIWKVRNKCTRKVLALTLCFV